MNRILKSVGAMTAAAALVLGVSQPASADPIPGFQFDPVKLEAAMDACMAYTVPADTILMGWVKVSTGEKRQWRCSSLRHMLLDDDGRPEHDPYVDPMNFMICTDRVVSYGFPRPATEPAYTRLIGQYAGTAKNANVLVNDANGDIATIYTSTSNDWAGCASGLV